VFEAFAYSCICTPSAHPITDSAMAAEARPAKRARPDDDTDEAQLFRSPRVGGKVFVVTGGTQGLGEAIALLLADEGAAGVVICGRSTENGARVSAELEKRGTTKALFVRADLGDEADCRAVMRAADETFGRVDGLVNCAASTQRGTWDDATVEHMDFLYRLNFRAPFILTQAAQKIMKREGKGGSIVNIGSVNGAGGISILPMYSSMKGAINTMTKNAAFAFRKDKVRVNCIAVGWMATPAEHDTMTGHHGKPEDWLDAADAAHPFGRILRPRDIAKMTVHLLSDDAEMQTGSIVDIHEQFFGCWD